MLVNGYGIYYIYIYIFIYDYIGMLTAIDSCTQGAFANTGCTNQNVCVPTYLKPCKDKSVYISDNYLHNLVFTFVQITVLVMSGK